ncbi:hypothetical protein PY479_07860 [Shewanella sp. A32]|uniref:hypothetical protein n=1 Tax=Shewanella sp. A32 TaxID=3031327 RepID=UPI0023B9DE99|nr:hypothetical protein [Shewanella sp. A32]MDF0534189.1 hypothetical protein [Shewanella sp. A32]
MAKFATNLSDISKDNYPMIKPAEINILSKAQLVFAASGALADQMWLKCRFSPTL